MSFLRYAFLIWTCLLVIARIEAHSLDYEEGTLAYAVGAEIFRINPRTLLFSSSPDYKFDTETRIGGLALTDVLPAVYFLNVDGVKKRIMKIYSDSNEPEVIADTGLSAPEELAVDWITGNVYFIDILKKHIGVCTPYGSHCTVILNSTKLNTPRSLVLDPKNGEMFWSEYSSFAHDGSEPSIWKSGMDGSGARVIVSKGLGRPKALTLDDSKGRLYWFDSKLKMIESVNLDGKDRQDVFNATGKHLNSLKIFHDKFYWIEGKKNVIESMDIETGDRETIVGPLKSLINDMDIHIDVPKTSFPNPCEKDPCPEICLLAGNSEYTCACKLGHEFDEKLNICKAKIAPTHLVIAAGNKVIHYHEDPLGKSRLHEIVMPIDISRIIYDPYSGYFIGDDGFTNSLFTIDFANNETERITFVGRKYLGGIATAVGIAEKPNDFGSLMERNVIYNVWSLTNLRCIERIDLENGKKERFTFEHEPQDILASTIPEKLFVVFKRGIRGSRIDLLDLQKPHGAKTVIRDLVGPKISLAYDELHKKVYFADETTGIIEYFETDDRCLTEEYRPCSDNVRHRLVSVDEKIVSLAFTNNKLFWTVRDAKVLQWVDLQDEYLEIGTVAIPGMNDYGMTDIAAAGKLKLKMKDDSH